ncbi:energy transducer TonB [Hymenobacter koreensis]|uniref:TonB C-terminal domain-containing protein n=1 Tax=Hymenobacter koreensis TaxID=1084523 RepID=A0ABP8IXS3_9BACT
MRTYRLIVGLLGLIGLGAIACQRENAAQTERPAPAAVTESVASADEVAADTLPAAARTTWHRLARRTRAGAPLVRYSAIKRSAQPDTAAPPADARLFDLTLKASEFFRIDPTTGAEVRGREGTIVRIPANALVDERQKPVTGQVWVELKECYSVADLLLSNHVSVAADGMPQQTAGMLLVRATTGNKVLQLAEGTALQIELPEETPIQPTLTLYHGQARRNQPVRWAAAAPAMLTSDRVYSRAYPMPGFRNGTADLNSLVRYPDAALRKGTKGLVLASFVVDENGEVVNPKIVRGLGNGCNEEVLRVLRYTSGRWTPGYRDGRAVKVKMTVPIRFNTDEGLLASTDSTLPPGEIVPNDVEPDEDAIKPSARGYASAQLGWLTWLRPWRTANHTAVTVAQEPDEHTSVRLVYPGAAAVLTGEAQNGQYVFAQAPSQQRAWLVGLRFTNGTPYLALRELVPGQEHTEALDFQETTLADLETSLAKLR